MIESFDIDERLTLLAAEAEQKLKKTFEKFDKIESLWSARVLKAFHNNEVSSTDFFEVSGYGYTDTGRDKLERIFAEVFGAEDALVRPQIMSGTHALALAFFGLLHPGDTMISITGAPYDSLLETIGLVGDSKGSLLKNGINYEQIELKNNDFDTAAIVRRIKKSKVRLVEIQRSRGYSDRKSLTIAKIERVIKAIKEADSDVIVMVDNCYGGFVEEKEPTMVGADILVSSLMKNLGAGHAISGGYIVGRRDLVWDISERFSAPGVGKDVGANFNQIRPMMQGIYSAPSVVCSAMKTMALASYMLEKLGYDVDPKFNEPRTDMIQTIKFGDREKLIAFCAGIQKGSPVDAHFLPVPDQTPGYPNEEIMASGSFITGSTIELSCDGPLIEPYAAYMQGGLTYQLGKLGILIALNSLINV